MGLSVYPGVAERGCGGLEIAIIAVLCKKVLCREPHEESPERPQCGFHFCLFGAVWGAQPQRIPRGAVFLSLILPLRGRAAGHLAAGAVECAQTGEPAAPRNLLDRQIPLAQQ